ncbi:MAG TPA: SRPBCC domain-containing protein [Candidatus Limnocylindrales bacterium]
MTDEFSGSVELSTSPEATWAVITNPLAVGRILPDCESVAPDGSGGLNVVVAVRQLFMTVRMDLHITWHDPQPIHHLRLELKGKPRGLGGALRLSVPLELEPSPAGTRIAYRATLELDGSLSSFRGQVSKGLQAQVDHLIRAVEREAGATPAS